MAHEAGKGSTPRPFSVSQEEYNNRWDIIFSRDKVSKEIEAEEKQEQDQKQDQSKEVNS
jgi:hypothetical protein